MKKQEDYNIHDKVIVVRVSSELVRIINSRLKHLRITKTKFVREAIMEKLGYRWGLVPVKRKK